MKKIMALPLFCGYIATSSSLAMQELSPLFTPADLKENVNSQVTRQRLLSSYQLSIDVLTQACAAYSQSLKSFNPHVGDTCCEIRAHMFASIPSGLVENFAELEKRAKSISAEIDFLKQANQSEIIPPNRKVYTFLELLESRNILPGQLPSELKQLQIALLLTRSKKTPFDFSDNRFTPDSLKGSELDFEYAQSYDLSKSLSIGLLRKSQKIMAQESVNYAQNELVGLKPTSLVSKPIVEQLKKAIGLEGSCVYKGERSTLAYFPLLVTLYSRAAQKGIPLLLKIMRFAKDKPKFYRTSQLYIPHQDRFVPAQSDSHADKKAMILEGLSFDGSYDEFEAMVKDRGIIDHCSEPNDKLEFGQRLLSHDIQTLLFADASMHPQFAHDKKDDNRIFENRDELPDLAAFMEKSQADAFKAGVCKKNMSLFYLSHVYADLIKNQL